MSVKKINDGNMNFAKFAKIEEKAKERAAYLVKK